MDRRYRREAYDRRAIRREDPRRVGRFVLKKESYTLQYLMMGSAFLGVALLVPTLVFGIMRSAISLLFMGPSLFLFTLGLFEGNPRYYVVLFVSVLIFAAGIYEVFF